MKKIYLKTNNKWLVYGAVALGLFFVIPYFHDWANEFLLHLHFCSHTACMIYGAIWISFGIVGWNKIKKRKLLSKINIFPFIILLVAGIGLMNMTYCDAEGIHFGSFFKEKIIMEREVVRPPCEDTDGGRIFLVSGTIRSGMDINDRCITNDVLRERYCRSTTRFASEDISCSEEFGDSFICESGECVETDVNCTDDDDCLGIQICEDGECVDPDCTDDDDCLGDEVCSDGRCVPECLIDSDCSTGYACVDEVCVPVWRETDEGNAPYIYGECIFGDDDCEDYEVLDDFCEDVWLTEYYLVGEEPTYTVINCEDMFLVCEDGACVVGWIETDDGMDPETYGECYTGDITDDTYGEYYEDECTDEGEELTEYYLSGDSVASTTYDCADDGMVCERGECVEGERVIDPRCVGICDAEKWDCYDGMCSGLSGSERENCFDNCDDEWEICYEYCITDTPECIEDEDCRNETQICNDDECEFIGCSGDYGICPCGDGIDNDGDGDIDCDDSDCQELSWEEGGCGTFEYSCDHRSPFPSCGGTCPTGQECITYLHGDSSGDNGWCSCMPITETSCGDGPWPECGGWCEDLHYCIFDTYYLGCFCSSDNCYETDNGYDIETYGICYDDTGEYSDYCLYWDTIVEYQCLGTGCTEYTIDCGALWGGNGMCYWDKISGEAYCTEIIP